MSPALLLILRLVALVILGSYLFLKHRQRAMILPPPADDPNWKGQGLDVSRLEPRLARLRSDYLAGLPPATNSGRFREGLVACAAASWEPAASLTRTEGNLSEDPAHTAQSE